MKAAAGTGSEKFDFRLTVHQLRPWPEKDALLAIGWQRGKNKKGAVKPVPAKRMNKPYALYEFNEVLEVGATLKRSSAGSAIQFNKKFLLLAVLDMSTGKPTASQGTVVINLADFANIAQGPRKLAFRVAVPKAISFPLAALGKTEPPSLVLTIECTYRGKLGPGSVASSGASAGSKLTTDLQSFFEPRAAKPRASIGPADGAADNAKGAQPELRAVGSRNGRASGEPVNGKEVSPIAILVKTALGKEPTRPEEMEASTSQALGANAGPEFDEHGMLRDSDDESAAPPPMTKLEAIAARGAAAARPAEHREPPAPLPREAPLAPRLDAANLRSAGASEASSRPQTKGGPPLSQTATPPKNPWAPSTTPRLEGDHPGNSSQGRQSDRVSEWLAASDNIPDGDDGGASDSSYNTGPTSASRQKSNAASPAMNMEMLQLGIALSDADGGARHRMRDLRSVLTKNRASRDIDEPRSGGVGVSTGSDKFPNLGAMFGTSSRSANGVAPDAAPGPRERQSTGGGGGHSGSSKQAGLSGLRRSHNGFDEPDNFDPPSDGPLPPAPVHLVQLPPAKTAPAEQAQPVERVKSAERAKPEERADKPAERGEKAPIVGKASSKPRWVGQDTGAAEATIKDREAFPPVAEESEDSRITNPSTAPSAVHSSSARQAPAEAPKAAPAPVAPASPAPASRAPPPAAPSSVGTSEAAPGRWKKSDARLKTATGSGPGSSQHATDAADREIADLTNEIAEAGERSDALQQELLQVGVLESSIYLQHARSAAKPGSPADIGHATHAPARRLLRAIAGLPKAKGSALAQQILLSLRATAVDGWTDDVPRAVYWWSNCLQMRLYLHQLQATHGGDYWPAAVLTAPLQQMECEIFERVEQVLWRSVMAPMLERGGGRRPTPGDLQEEAMLRWVAALDVANDRLVNALVTVEGYATLFLPRMQEALVRRIDYFFFTNILHPPANEPPASSTPKKVTPGRPPPPHPTNPNRVPLTAGGTDLPHFLLPFVNNGHLTFQTGMHLKMAIMHLSHWAHDHDLKDEIANGGTRLYPFLRSIADALMMRKELLLEPATRSSVCAALSLPSLLALLERFQPDGYSPDPIDDDVMATLRDEAARDASEDPVLLAYQSPSVDEVVALTNEQLAERKRPVARRRNISMTEHELQTGHDSDSDLKELTITYTGTAPAALRRFDLVLDLWNRSQDRRLE